MRVEHMQFVFASFMLGISFKVRFYRRYCKKLGWDLMHREKNRLRR
jgi:hypothetical protein